MNKADLIEPNARNPQWKDRPDVVTSAELELSRVISLRRIADALEKLANRSML